MTRLSAMDLLAAAAGQPTSRELTSEDLQLVAGYKEMCRELLFQPPCECEICLRQYRTKDQQDCIHWHYLEHVDNPADLAQSFARSIKEDRELLYRTITASGSAILKRWRAGEGKRRHYLVEAQPEIYPYSQPLIDIASRVQKLTQVRRLRVAYLLPYVNIEDLSKDSANFIRLLHYRTTFPPQDWVHYDNAQLQPGWKYGSSGEKSAEGCIIMQGEQYGTWKEFDRSAVHHGYAYGAIRGLLILEAQQILMSFLRKMVFTIIKDAGSSKLGERQLEAPKTSLTSAACAHYDLTSCSKWIRFIQAEPHRDQAWLSVASIYTTQPYSAPAYFDIDTMIEIADTKAMEAADELWLLQTDLDYAHDLMKRHEREWLDSVPSVRELKKFSPKDKMDNIGYIMTVKVVIQAREWQWLVEQCQAVKTQMEKPESKTRVGELFPVEYERALCGLQYLLREAQTRYQDGLSRLFLKSKSFSSIMEAKALGKDHRDSWALGFDFKDYSQLYQKDRISWCLYNLTKDPRGMKTFERSVVMQHLEKFLEACPRQEIERIDKEMYKCISDMAAVERMLSILELHRPNFAYLAQSLFRQPSLAWAVHSCLLMKPSNVTCTNMDLGSAIESSERFRMPKGSRDEQWLTRRDQAQQALNGLWRKARHAYQMMSEASNVPQKLIEPQLETMRQGDSLEHKVRLDMERQQILNGLQAARQRAFEKSVIPPKDTQSRFSAHRDQLVNQTQEPAKEKIKTRPDAPSASASLHAKYAALFGKLAIDDEVGGTKKPPPVLYTFKQNSVPFQVISLMFPDRSKGIEDGAKMVEWLDFVSTMKTLGFGAEHRGGSAFTFKGAIRLPSDPLTLQKRSISAHMPHPSTEMSPTLLQSLGRRCNRRFGWQRANFAAEGSGVGQGT